MSAPRLLFLPPDTAATARIFTPAVMGALASLASLDRNALARQLTSEELRERVGAAELCVTGSGSPRLGEEVVAAADRLRLVLHAANLRLIREDALLVSIGRGELIDEQALAAELATGRFRAVLDVYAREPLDPQSPLCGMPNVTCFPHLGGATENGREALGWDLVENLREYLAGGSPHGLVTRERALAQSEY
jgi:phosphoglycerate dehydrogenase-like enzyme